MHVTDGSRPTPNPTPASVTPGLKVLKEHGEPLLTGMARRDLGTEDKAAAAPSPGPRSLLARQHCSPQSVSRAQPGSILPSSPVLTSMSPLPSPKFTAWAYKLQDASSSPAEIACDPKPHNIVLVVKRDEKFRAIINSCKETFWFHFRLRSGGYLNMTGTWLNCLGPCLFKAQNHTAQFVVLICSC